MVKRILKWLANELSRMQHELPEISSENEIEIDFRYSLSDRK